MPFRICAAVGVLTLMLAAGFADRSGNARSSIVDEYRRSDRAFDRLSGAPDNAAADSTRSADPEGDEYPEADAMPGADGARERAPGAHAYPSSIGGPSVSAAGRVAPKPIIAVSIEQRRLWLYEGGNIVHTAPVAVGKGDRLEHGARSWHFSTPRGRRVVLGKEEARVWVPPDWHYVELAQEHGFRLSRLTRGRSVALDGGRRLSVRGNRIVLRHADGRSEVLPRDEEVVFDSTLFIPPYGTLNRQIPGELGAFALDLGDGYLIHGTADSTSIGRAASHGCIRLRDEDVRKLFEHVPVGTPVWIH